MTAEEVTIDPQIRGGGSMAVAVAVALAVDGSAEVDVPGMALQVAAVALNRTCRVAAVMDSEEKAGMTHSLAANTARGLLATITARGLLATITDRRDGMTSTAEPGNSPPDLIDAVSPS
jgi:hypothetical protein